MSHLVQLGLNIKAWKCSVKLFHFALDYLVCGPRCKVEGLTANYLIQAPEASIACQFVFWRIRVSTPLGARRPRNDLITDPWSARRMGRVALLNKNAVGQRRMPGHFGNTPIEQTRPTVKMAPGHSGGTVRRILCNSIPSGQRPKRISRVSRSTSLLMRGRAT